MNENCLKMSVDGFKWKENASESNKKLIRNYDEGSDKGYIFEADVKHPKRRYSFHSNLPFFPEKWRSITATSFCAISMIKNFIFFT